MHPKEFKGFSEHISDLYTDLYDELHKLKRENKILLERIAKRRRILSAQPNKIETYSPMPQKILKMGADWHIEGDYLAPILLIKRIKFNIPICNAKISPAGQIVFTCNKKFFLLRDENFYLVEDTIKPLHPNSMKNDLTENFRSVFEFMGESLIVFHRNTIIKFTDNIKVWSIPLNNVYHIEISNNKIYVGTHARESKVLVFEEIGFNETECVNAFDCIDAIKSFHVANGNIVGYNDFKMYILNTLQTFSETGRIVAMDVSHDMVYSGDAVLTIKAYKTGPTLEMVDSLVLKKPIFSIKCWNKFVVITCQDKSVAIWDIKQKTCMKIVGGDNIVDISTNKNTLCCVDNNGSLRIWQIRSD